MLMHVHLRGKAELSCVRHTARRESGTHPSGATPAPEVPPRVTPGGRWPLAGEAADLVGRDTEKLSEVPSELIRALVAVRGDDVLDGSRGQCGILQTAVAFLQAQAL